MRSQQAIGSFPDLSIGVLCELAQRVSQTAMRASCAVDVLCTERKGLAAPKDLAQDDSKGVAGVAPDDRQELALQA